MRTRPCKLTGRIKSWALSITCCFHWELQKLTTCLSQMLSHAAPASSEHPSWDVLFLLYAALSASVMPLETFFLSCYTQLSQHQPCPLRLSFLLYAALSASVMLYLACFAMERFSQSDDFHKDLVTSAGAVGIGTARVLQSRVHYPSAFAIKYTSLRWAQERQWTAVQT